MFESEALLGAARVLVWECAAAWFAWNACRWGRSAAERTLLFFSISITSTALIAETISFLRVNSILAYALGAGLLALGGFALRRKDEAQLHASWKRFGLAAPFLFLLICAMRPVSEVDSLYNLHFLLNWLDNRSTPYDFAFHYVPFWELSVFPVLVLSRTDLFFWIASIKPIVLIGSAFWLLADEFGLRASTRLVAVASCLLFQFFWFPPSGVATLKNDSLHACGETMLALVLVRALRGKWGTLEAVILGFACAFLCVKFSGPVFLIAALGASLVLAPKAMWSARRELAACFAFWLLAVGHFYAHNLLLFGNPFYPFQINAPGIHLPGLADLSNTSILYSLRDPRLWKAFFTPEHGISPAGILFPLLLPAILVGSAYVLISRRRLTVATGFALFQLLTWGLYFRSVYSASGQPGDLQFVLSDLNSIRYVEGALLSALICAVALLPERWSVPLLSLNGASCIYLMFRRGMPLPFETVAAAWLLALVVGGMAWRWRVLAPIFTALLLLEAAYLDDRQRPNWLPEWKPVWSALWEQPSRSVAVVTGGENSGLEQIRFPVSGRWLQHRVKTDDWKALAEDPQPADYIVRMKTGDAGMAGAPCSLLQRYELAADAPGAMLLAAKPGKNIWPGCPQ